MGQDNDVILYSYFRSSASYRVRIALALKDLPYTYRPVHLVKNGGEQKSPEYLKLNPMGHVPTLVVKNQILSESIAIIDYLDDYAPKNPQLFPQDPLKRAKVLQICEVINSGIQPLANLKVLQHLETLGLSKEQLGQWSKHWTHKGLTSLEEILAPVAGSHCLGNTWSAADCFLMPQGFNAERVGLDLTAYPTISRLYRELGKTEAVIKAHPANQPDSE